MATIPLPALHVETQQQSPLALYAQAAQIRALGQQEQTRQLQQTGLEQENQQRALALQDQMALRESAPNHVTRDSSGNVTGFDNEGFLNEAAGKGVNPATLNQLRINYATATKDLAAASETQRANEQAKNKAAYEVLEGVRAAEPAKRADVLRQSLPNLQRLGVDTSSLVNAPTDDKSLDAHEAAISMHGQQLADAETIAKTNETNQKAQLEKMEAAEKGSPLMKIENDPTMFAGDKLPATMAYLQSRLGDADPVQAARAQRLLKTANVAKSTQLAIDASKKATDQAIADGDPNAAAKLLVDGVVAPSQIISARKPEFAQKAFTAAAALQPGWNAQKADADFKVASSPANVAFFGSAKSLTDKGGTLDQLKAAAKDIPQNQIPVFNSLADWVKAAGGSGPIAKYAAINLGVADDYAKVMGGGTATDTGRLQGLNLVPAKASPEQRDAAIEGIRGAVGSQLNSRVGANPVMRKMYADQVAGAPGGGAKPLTPAEWKKQHGIP